MPKQRSPRQPANSVDWFHGRAGGAVLASETAVVAQAVNARRGQPCLWLAPLSLPLPEMDGTAACLQLVPDRVGQGPLGDRWGGGLRCGWPLPVANGSMAVVVVQHVGDLPLDRAALIMECSRVLAAGGWLWLFALNPMSPYRRHWQGRGLMAIEPFTWRRQLRRAALEPMPVSSGIGPRWRVASSPNRQHGAGLRAACLLQAQKRRVVPIMPSPVRALQWQPGMPAT